jgi:fructose 1,6-bisphosphate aldolase/phosphatase
VIASTSRLHNIAGKYTGKDDPVMLVRVRQNFPATGEVLAPYALDAYVAGGMRGSHNMPLMPVALMSGVSYFDGPPVVSCAAFCVHDGKFTAALDNFARRQGFFGAAMLPMTELEYTGIVEKLKAPETRFRVRAE